MSLINEALRKAEQDRAAQRLAVYPGAPSHRVRHRRPHERSSTARVLLWSTTAVAVVSVAAFALFFRNPPPSIDPASAAEFADTSPAPTFVTDPLPPDGASRVAADSPFGDSSADAPLSEPPPASDYELAGMTAVGDDTLISVMRRSDQRSVWVPVGKSVGEITAVSYNALSDEAVIRVRGQLLTVGMRSGPIESAGEAAPQAAE